MRNGPDFGGKAEVIVVPTGVFRVVAGAICDVPFSGGLIRIMREQVDYWSTFGLNDERKRLIDMVF